MWGQKIFVAQKTLLYSTSYPKEKSTTIEQVIFLFFVYEKGLILKKY